MVIMPPEEMSEGKLKEMPAKPTLLSIDACIVATLERHRVSRVVLMRPKAQNNLPSIGSIERVRLERPDEGHVVHEQIFDWPTRIRDVEIDLLGTALILRQVNGCSLLWG
jgi:hypothetical protein